MPRFNSEPVEDLTVGLAEFGCGVFGIAALFGGFAILVSLLGGF